MAEGSDWDYPSASDVITIGDEDDDSDLLPPMGPALGASYTRASGRHIDPIRLMIWTLAGLLVLCVGVLVLAGWSRSAAQNAPASSVQSNSNPNQYPLQIVFGDRGTDVSTPYGPNGSQSACTDETYDSQSGAWTCAAWSVDTVGFPIQAATPVDGQCSERRVDQSAGRWVCVQS